ncbi:MAG: RNA polymerase sigma factor [Candidatus Spechtbacterales bacterium]
MKLIKLKTNFIKAYDAHHASIYRFLRVKVASDELAQDLTAEAFAKAWDYLSRNPEKYPDNERAYLYKTAYNTMADHYRKSSTSKEFAIDDENLLEYLDNTGQTGVLDTSGSDIGDILDIRTSMESVQTALSELGGNHAELITLRYIEELSNTEIAEILGKTEVAVRVGVFRALKELRGKLTTEEIKMT